MRFKWRQIHLALLKRTIVSCGFAIVLALVLAAYEVTGNGHAVKDVALERVKDIPVVGLFVGLLAALPVTGLHEFIDTHPAAITGAAFGLVLFLSLHKGFPRRFLHYWVWPDRPFFFEPPLEEVERQGQPVDIWAADPRRRLSRLSGREADFEWLASFARCDRRFAWASLSGPPGRGKTRLAIEWCERLQKSGWDAGLLSDAADLKELGYWRPRRRTILVIDEAFKRNDGVNAVTKALAEIASRSRHCIRVLFVDHGAYAPAMSKGTVAIVSAAFSEAPHRLLEPLSETDADALVTSLDARLAITARGEIVVEAKGEPLLVLTLWAEREAGGGPIDIDRLLALKADQVLSRAEEPALRQAVIQSALAPPVPWPTGVDLDQVRAIFPDTRLNQIELPAYRPDLIGDRIVLRGLAPLGEADQSRLIAEAWTRAPEATAYALRRMWLHNPKEREAAARVLSGLPPVDDLDESGATSAAANAARRGSALALLTLRPSGRALTVQPSDKAWFQALNDLRFGGVIDGLSLEALAAVLDQSEADCPSLVAFRRVTADDYQQGLELVWAFADADMDQCTAGLERLEAFIAHWPAGSDRALISATGLVNAAMGYGDAATAGREEGWRRLGECLEALKGLREAYGGNEEIVLEYAKALTNASNGYAVAATAGREEGWWRLGECLEALKGLREAYGGNEEIVLHYAMGLVNAALGYGDAAKAVREDGWRRLGECLEALKGLREAYGGNEKIALDYAKALVNAVGGYGEAAKAGREEGWRRLGECLEAMKGLREAYGGNEEIVLRYAQGLFNAEIAYRAKKSRSAEWVAVRRSLVELFSAWRLNARIGPELMGMASRANFLSELGGDVSAVASPPTTGQAMPARYSVSFKFPGSARTEPGKPST